MLVWAIGAMLEFVLRAGHFGLSPNSVWKNVVEALTIITSYRGDTCLSSACCRVEAEERCDDYS